MAPKDYNGRMKTLLPNPAILSLEKIFPQADAIIMVVTTSRPQAPCPECQQLSPRIHSRYQRGVTDLSWGEITVQLELQTRKFFCDNDECRQRIFCERLPEVVAPYGRQTLRFNQSLTTIGFALGGRAGERLAADLCLPSGARTLLRRIYDEPVSKAEHVRILGVDDFAFRKGQRYGTILVDLEQHRVIDLLPDREGATLEGWLKSHPEVEFITRDRALAYADGASKGAPQAVQVADRFHLLKNLAEAFENLVRHRSSVLRDAALEVSPRHQTERMLLAEGLLNALPERMPKKPPAPSQQSEQNRAERVTRYEECRRLKRLGLSNREIARRTGMCRETVRKFIRAETFPERVTYPPRSQTTEPYAEYLKKRLQEGCRNGALLYQEIKAQGYRGGSATVRRLLRSWKHQLPVRYQRLDGLPDFDAPAPRQAVWWLLKPEELEPDQKEYVRELQRLSPEISSGLKLVKEFQALLVGKQAVKFDQWRLSIEQSGLKELQSFSVGLMKDEAAVRAAMIYDWSNGQVEGNVNRLKMIKRMMFGRASFAMLKARVLHRSG
jgi:transposase